VRTRSLAAPRNREHQGIAPCRPSRWLVGSSVVDVLIASTLAIFGIGMSPVPAAFVGETLVAAAAFALVLDFAKVPVFRLLLK
jgi:H+-transporting ATPase